MWVHREWVGQFLMTHSDMGCGSRSTCVASIKLTPLCIAMVEAGAGRHLSDRVTSW